MKKKKTKMGRVTAEEERVVVKINACPKWSRGATLSRKSPHSEDINQWKAMGRKMKNIFFGMIPRRYPPGIMENYHLRWGLAIYIKKYYLKTKEE
jgi:hypothetical protein